MTYLKIIQEMKAVTWLALGALLNIDEDLRVDALFQASVLLLNKLNEFAVEDRKKDIVEGTRELIARMRSTKSDADENHVELLIKALNDRLHIEELAVINANRLMATYSFINHAHARKG